MAMKWSVARTPVQHGERDRVNNVRCPGSALVHTAWTSLEATGGLLGRAAALIRARSGLQLCALIGKKSAAVGLRVCLEER